MQQLKQRWQVGRRLSASPLAVASPTPTRTRVRVSHTPSCVSISRVVQSVCFGLKRVLSLCELLCKSNSNKEDLCHYVRPVSTLHARYCITLASSFAKHFREGQSTHSRLIPHRGHTLTPVCPDSCERTSHAPHIPVHRHSISNKHTPPLSSGFEAKLLPTSPYPHHLRPVPISPQRDEREVVGHD
jgi:hypothetical protein